MASRKSLQSKLEDLLGMKHVYFNPPEGYRMNYPAIVFQLDNKNRTAADNTAYLIRNRYQIKYIDYEPESPVIDKILGLPFCSFERSYKSDNLNHTILNLYW